MGTPDIKSRMDTDMKSQPTTAGAAADAHIDLNHYRKLVRSYIDLRRYKTALFWAEKVVTLSSGDPMDVYWLAQCMFMLREFHRAAHVIRSRGLERTSLHCLYLAAESLFEAKDCQQAIELLNVIESTAGVTGANATAFLQQPHQPPPPTTPENSSELLAAIWLLKGKVLESMDNRAQAMDAYVQALQHSVYCTEALDGLVQHEMLMLWEEHELIGNLPMATQCTDAEAKVLQLLYCSKMKKYYETNFPYNNSEQTPMHINYEFVKSIKVLTDKMRSELNTDEPKRDQRTSATPYALRPNILSPANKLLMDLKTTPNYSIQSSILRTSFTQLGDSLKSTPATTGPQSAQKAHAATVRSAAVAPIALDVACRQLKENSVDMIVANAERLFYNSEYKQCMQVLDECFLADPYHAAGLTVQIGCLVELRESNKLFYLAHNLIDLYPDQAISWYAVGCYYDLNNKSDPARRYLAKATTLDRMFGPAWLAYGHSFAKENEHDQAMAAYFKATQLMRGCHLPLLYIGVECGLTKNHELAEKFFYQAMSIAPLDVFVLHELAVIKFEYEDYESAEDILRDTLEVVCKIGKQHGDRSLTARWEPLFNNLGHCCRKNGKYAEALQLHQRALALKPLCAGTYTAIGFVQSLMGRLDDAIESLHRSLSIKRDDIFASTLLRYCIEDLTDEDALPDGVGASTDETTAGPAVAVPKRGKKSTTAGGGGAPISMFMTSTGTMATAAAAASSSSSEVSSAEVRLKLKFDDTVASMGSTAMDSSLDMSM